MPKPECDALRDDLPWEMPVTLVGVTAPNSYNFMPVVTIERLLIGRGQQENKKGRTRYLLSTLFTEVGTLQGNKRNKEIELTGEDGEV